MPVNEEVLERLLVDACETYSSVMLQGASDKDRVLAANGARDFLKNMGYSATPKHPSVDQLAQARKAREDAKQEALGKLPTLEEMKDMQALHS